MKICCLFATVFGGTPAIRKTTYDPATDFSYIIGVSAYTFGVAVRSDAPWRTFLEFSADSKTRPSQINYGVIAPNGLPNTTMLRIAKQQGIRWISAPFKGVADAINALLGGHIHAIADSTGWAPASECRPIQATGFFQRGSHEKLARSTDMKEVGTDIIVASGPFGIAGPKGMDESIIRVLHDAFRAGMTEPSFQEVLVRLNQEPWYLSSEDYRNCPIVFDSFMLSAITRPSPAQRRTIVLAPISRLCVEAHGSSSHACTDRNSTGNGRAADRTSGDTASDARQSNGAAG